MSWFCSPFSRASGASIWSGLEKQSGKKERQVLVAKSKAMNDGGVGVLVESKALLTENYARIDENHRLVRTIKRMTHESVALLHYSF